MVKAGISKWEMELKKKATSEQIYVDEWEPLVVDLSNTRGQLNLFKKFIQTYWIMKILLAKSMTNNQQ